MQKGNGDHQMFFKRVFSLIGGKLNRWLKARELHDPEAVYEAAISDRLRRYQQLKGAAAGVIYMRNKLERELRLKSAELAEVCEQAAQAAEINEDECALLLIHRKHELEEDSARLKQELSELTHEVDDAKKGRDRKPQGRKGQNAGAVSQCTGTSANPAGARGAIVR
jgi:phage shock protein A